TRRPTAHDKDGVPPYVVTLISVNQDSVLVNPRRFHPWLASARLSDSDHSGPDAANIRAVVLPRARRAIARYAHHGGAAPPRQFDLGFFARSDRRPVRHSGCRGVFHRLH